MLTEKWFFCPDFPIVFLNRRMCSLIWIYHTNSHTCKPSYAFTPPFSADSGDNFPPPIFFVFEFENVFFNLNLSSKIAIVLTREMVAFHEFYGSADSVVCSVCVHTTLQRVLQLCWLCWLFSPPDFSSAAHSTVAAHRDVGRCPYSLVFPAQMRLCFWMGECVL